MNDFYLVGFLSTTMKRMSFVIDRNLCFDWFSERLQKVASIAVIQVAMAYDMVASAFLIVFYVTKLWTRRWGPLGYRKDQSVCSIVVLPS